MAHDSLLFNFHDLTLLFAVNQYLLLAAFLLFTRRLGDKSTLFLIIILIFNALELVNVFMIWSDPIRQTVLNLEPNLLFWGGLGFWLQGPLLYWYVSSVLYRNFKFTIAQLAHLLPVAIVFFILYDNYYSLEVTAKIEIMRDLSFVFGRLMAELVTYRYISVIVYGLWCFFLLYRYRSEVRKKYAGYSASERRWLRWIVFGVVGFSAWNLFVHKVGIHFSSETSNLMGLTGNYLDYIFVNTLVFLSMRYVSLFDGLVVEQAEETIEPEKKKEFTPEQIQRVEAYMLSEKPYLQNSIYIEDLAKNLSLPARTFSNILNHHFNMNFFEFINSYRIADAKRLLTEPASASKTVLEIIHETGFGSKSSFNSTFKQQVGMTPSEFRKTKS